LLGLHVEPAGTLETALAGFRTQRSQRAVRIVELLRALGAGITMADVEFQAGEGAVGRPHVARALIAAGVCKDFREAFDRYLGAGRPAFVPKPRLGAREAIDLVHAASGLAIWAHPGPEGRRDRLEALIAAGLDGVEVLHPGHSGDDTRRLLALCEHFDLLASGGSDWHGESLGPRNLGAMRVPAAWLARQDERLAARRAAGVS
jgi:predicted metal-dependent phosphoesterase TrpH